MSLATYSNLIGVTDLLHQWLLLRIHPEGLTWLQAKRTEIVEGASIRAFFVAFSTVPRYVGKADLKLTHVELRAAEKQRRGWCPSHWSVDQVARVLLLLALPQDDIENYLRSLNQLFSTAEVRELVALYQALPLLPYPERHRTRAAEGIRTNMAAVFNAIALRNPYPAEYLDDLAWNQMVLKAVLVESPLHLIQGIDRRANPALAQMLIDYAHERWSAKRSVSYELWRPVGQFVTPAMLTDLERVFADPDPVQQAAAALTCANSPLPGAQMLLAQYPELQAMIHIGQLTWDSLSQS